MAWQSHAGTRSVPSRLQQACFKRDRHTCQRCGYVGRQGDGTLHADHIHNRAAGGQDTLTNLATLCTTCHSGKTAQERTAGINARKSKLRLPPEPHPGLKPQVRSQTKDGPGGAPTP